MRLIMTNEINTKAAQTLCDFHLAKQIMDLLAILQQVHRAACSCIEEGAAYADPDLTAYYASDNVWQYNQVVSFTQACLAEYKIRKKREHKLAKDLRELFHFPKTRVNTLEFFRFTDSYDYHGTRHHYYNVEHQGTTIKRTGRK